MAKHHPGSRAPACWGSSASPRSTRSSFTAPTWPARIIGAAWSTTYCSRTRKRTSRPGCPEPAPTPPRGKRGRRRGCRGHRTDARDRRSPIGATWSASPVPAPRQHRCPTTGSPMFTGALLALQSRCCELAASLRHVHGFPVLGLLRRLRPSPGHQPTAGLPVTALAGGGEGDPKTVPTFAMHRSAGSAPCSSPAASPHLRRSPSVWPPTRPTYPRIGVASPSIGSACTATRPASTRLEPVPRLRRFNHLFTLVTPVCLASRAPAIWWCQPVPSLSGLLAALPRTSRIRLPSASPGCCDSPEERVSHPPPGTRRLVAHAKGMEPQRGEPCVCSSGNPGAFVPVRGVEPAAPLGGETSASLSPLSS
jgi:hypothetical protein